MTKVVTDYEVVHDSGESGREAFAVLRRMMVKPKFSDGSSGEAHENLVLLRRGIDAVTILPYVKRANVSDTLVLLRAGQRPSIWLRRRLDVAVPEPDAPVLLWEAVAGVREWSDNGEEGLRARAGIELEEEVGLQVNVKDIEPLGPGFFPTPGLYPERVYTYCVDVSEATLRAAHAKGDGGSAEAGAMVRVLTLGEALRACVSGELVDGKTELLLHRLTAKLLAESTRTVS